MPSYLGWTIVTIPSTPPAPASIEFTQYDAVAINMSPFTGQQQVQKWGGKWMEASVTMPPLTHAQAQAWIAFLRALEGQANVFQFTSAFNAAFPASVTDGSTSGTRYWRLKGNARKWSISGGKIYGLSFDIREAL